MKRYLSISSIAFLLCASLIGFTRPTPAHAACNTITRSGQGQAFITLNVQAGDSVTASTTGRGVVIGDRSGILVGGVQSASYTFTSATTIVALTNSPAGPVTLTVERCTAGSVTFTNFTDGRLNNHDAWETAAVYCRPEGVVVLVLGNPDWTLGLSVTFAEINAVPHYPKVNTLIKAGNGAQLYRLTSGELQLNAPGLNPADGEYVFVFQDCPQN